MSDQERRLAGLVSAAAEQLYGRLADSGGLRIGTGPDEVNMDSAAARELAELDLLYGKPSDASWVQVVSTAVAIQLLLSRRQQEIMSAHDQVIQGWNVLESLLKSSQADPSTQGASGALIELVTHRATLNTLSVEFYLSAREELSTTNTGHSGNPLGKHQALLPPKAALANGARYRGIYDHSYAASPAGARILHRSRQAGEEVRIRSTLPAKTLLVDGSVALIALNETGVGGAAVVRSPQLIALLKQWFELLWNDPGTSGSAVDDGPLSRQQRHVLRLLATGMTDDAIARASDMSVRTVRRHVASILEMLGIQTRFAAGVAAAKKGWI